MITVKISYPDRNNVETSKSVSFTEEFIKDDIECVLNIIKENFKLVIDAADKEIWA